MATITPASFDAKKLSFSEIRKLDNGSQQVYLNYDNKRLRVQAPCMPVPMDASDYQNNKKYKVNISFRDQASNPKVAAYYKMLEEIDAFVVDHATKNARTWFKMPSASHETVSAFFTKSAKVSKDKEGNPKTYPPTQGLALKQRNGAFDSEIYDNRNQLMEGVTPLEVFRRGCEISTINEVTGIWIIGTKFGLTWKLYQARVDHPSEGAGARGFLGAEGEDEDTPVVARAAGGAGSISATEESELFAAVMPAEDGGDDEDGDDVEENTVKPVPIPEVKKTKVAAPAVTAAAPATPAVAAAAAPKKPKVTVKKQ